MSEQQQANEELPGDKIIEPRKYPLSRTLGFGASTLAVGGIVDLAAHLGPTGLVVGALAAYVAAKHGPELVESITDLLPALPARQFPSSEKRGILDRAFRRSPESEQEATQEQAEVGEMFDTDDEVARILPTVPESRIQGERDILLAPKRWTPTLFSQVLSTFTPSLQTIFLGYLQDGTPVFVPAKALCHVALAGSTGQGKSTLIRLLMAQLCKAGASILLLNPHYTHYDLEADEDWTPYEPYLVYDPMECRKYEVIEFYLKQVATELLPRRLEKYAHSKPLGKPYFLVLDELPAIIRKVPNAPEYLETILREGRKVGIFLIVAATDFLVKTIFPQGGGAVRDCFRTAMYVGGDPTTARILLDMKASEVPEDALGKGTIMLRCSQVKQTALASIPYVDNQSLYQLLGPSTYEPTNTREEDMYLENLMPVRNIPSAEPPVRPTPIREQVASYPSARPYAHPTSQLSPELQRALEAWQGGANSVRKLMRILSIPTYYQANQLYQQMKAKRLID